MVQSSDPRTMIIKESLISHFKLNIYLFLYIYIERLNLEIFMHAGTKSYNTGGHQRNYREIAST